MQLPNVLVLAGLLSLTCPAAHADLWVERVGAAGVDRLKAVAVDAEGSVYVTGTFTGTVALGTTGVQAVSEQGSADVLVGKLDRYGNWLWARSAGGAGVDEGKAIALDSDGNAYVAGALGGPSVFGATQLQVTGTPGFVAKLDKDGNWLWARIVGDGGDAYANGVAVDDAGNAYVVGGAGPDASTFETVTPPALGGRDMFAARYDAQGACLWARRLGGSGDDEAMGVAADAGGTVYVTGTRQRDTTESSFSFVSGLFWFEGLERAGLQDVDLLALDAATGSEQWVGAAGGFSPGERGNALTVTDDAVYLTGEFSGDICFGRPYAHRALRVRWLPLGLPVFEGEGTGCGGGSWPTEAVGDLGLNLTPPDLSSGAPSMFLAKYSKTGVFQWARSMESPGAASAGRATAVTSGGGVLAAGESGGRAFAAAWGAAGNPLWTLWTQGGEGDAAGASAVAIARTTGDAFLAGEFSGEVNLANASDSLTLRSAGSLETPPATEPDGLVAKLDPATGAWLSDRFRLEVAVRNTDATPYDLEGGARAVVFPTSALPPGTTPEDDFVLAEASVRPQFGPGAWWLPKDQELSTGYVTAGTVRRDMPAIDGGRFLESWRGTGSVSLAVTSEDRTRPEVHTNPDGSMTITYPTTTVHLTEGQQRHLTFALGESSTLTWTYKPYMPWEIGRPLVPPAGSTVLPAESGMPDIRILRADEAPGSNPANSVFFHTADSNAPRIYFQRPVVAEVKWKLPASETQPQWVAPDDRRVTEVYRSVWPPPSAIHLAGSFPVPLQPAASEFTYVGMPYSSSAGATDTNKSFEAATPGYSLLLFSEEKDKANPQESAAITFEVVQTVAWDARDPETGAFLHLVQKAWPIGVPLSDAAHELTGENGYVLDLADDRDAPFDGDLYKRETRQGPIFPVNEVIPGTHHDLVVAWYAAENPRKIPWPVKWVRYAPRWPDDLGQPVRTIVLASGKGSGALPEHQYTGRLYNQPDRSKPGYNPNEEHALLLGNALYAIREDLNTGATSEPYALLKYQDPTTREWAMEAFKVTAEAPPTHTFDYGVEAGAPITAPAPLDLLPAVAETYESTGTDYHHVDHKLGHWAKGASDDPASPAQIVMRWYYPMQKGFYFPDHDGDGEPDAVEGDPVPFRNGGGHCSAPPVSGTVPPLSGEEFGRRCSEPPAAVTYRVAWPDDAPVLQVGETLTDSKYGLPDVSHMAAAQVIFDQSAQGGGGPLAKLFDPYSERSVDLPALSDRIATESLGTRKKFPDLPHSLRSRVFYDPTNTKLLFRGLTVDPGIGEPLLLANVMTDAERLRLRAVPGADPDWEEAVDALYAATRDPNGVAADLPEGGSVTNPFRSGGVFSRQAGPDPSKPPVLATWGLPLGLEKELDAGTWATQGDLRYHVKPHALLGLPKALTAGMAQAQGYVVLAENDDPSLGAAPVKLHVIQVAKGPYRGEIKVVQSDNLFDEKLTLRHTGDFGGEPERVYFEWYTKPDETGLSPAVPAGSDTGGWTLWSRGWGLSDITIEGAQDVRALSDNWFVVRYYYGNAYPSLTVASDGNPDAPPAHPDDPGNWSAWAGAPGGQGAQLAEGWLKRVFGALNPFEARVKDFREAPTNTNVSMVAQLGQSYEGDIALNSSAENLNDVGLIEAYETVFHRGQTYSLDAGRNYGPANVALLNAATRIGDFYALLGNEAYADALDPTIGFDTRSQEFGSAAPSIFAFENQLDSLLEEELVLLRGRDDALSTTRARPVYNRLVWNFTGSDGEVAYVQAYNLADQDGSGVVDELDAKAMYPQGHGDAWGHYLTAVKSWYRLIRHDNFSWEPRVESVLVGGAPVPVDYLDERKFAQAAASKAKVGTEIVGLTYRKHYVDDPAGQWQGYKDADPERAWGVDEWARRAGVGAYLDWVTANALLPAQDPNPQHTGIQRIDRTTVPELRTLASEFRSIQSHLDQADIGLNPLGLAKGVVPFDIDPARVAAGETHFEQIYARAVGALENAKTVFDYANDYTRRLRGNEDTLVGFKRHVQEQERDCKSRLIELFGYPYQGDIGPQGTYPSGYDGPDLFHYMYLNVPELTGLPTDRLDRVAHTATFDYNAPNWNVDPSSNWVQTQQITVSFPEIPDAPWRFDTPATWGERRAPGELQLALFDLVKAHADYERGLAELNEQLDAIDGAAELLKAKYNVAKDQVTMINAKDSETHDLDKAVVVLRAYQVVFKRVQQEVAAWFKSPIEATPGIVGFSNDVFSTLRGSLHGISGGLMVAAGWLSDAASVTEEGLRLARDRRIREADWAFKRDDKRYEVQQAIQELGKMTSGALVKLQDLYTLQTAIEQALGRYGAAVARGDRLLTELEQFRKEAAADVQDYRYQDMAFRVFRNDAVQKYRASFDLAARYAYLAATAYDYETNLLGGDDGAGREFLTDIVRHRSLGEVIGDRPVAGSAGLADPLARLGQNFAVYKTQLGFNNPQTETTRFSLRSELFRLKESSDDAWRRELRKHVVDDLWRVPEFRRFCRPIAPESSGSQPGLVLRFPSEVTFGRNFFGFPLGPADSAYDPTHFSTKVRSVGVWFTGYDEEALSRTPRVYLVPAGADVLRSPSGDSFGLRDWYVADQRLPVPFPISTAEVELASWIPANDSLSEDFGGIRRFSSLRAYPEALLSAEDPDRVAAETTADTRLVGRSVWNTDWVLIIPAGTILYDDNLADGHDGIEAFIGQVEDIKLFFQTYAYSGN